MMNSPTIDTLQSPKQISVIQENISKDLFHIGGLSGKRTKTKPVCKFAVMSEAVNGLDLSNKAIEMLKDEHGLTANQIDRLPRNSTPLVKTVRKLGSKSGAAIYVVPIKAGIQYVVLRDGDGVSEEIAIDHRFYDPKAKKWLLRSSIKTFEGDELEEGQVVFISKTTT